MRAAPGERVERPSGRPEQQTPRRWKKTPAVRDSLIASHRALRCARPAAPLLHGRPGAERPLCPSPHDAHCHADRLSLAELEAVSVVIGSRWCMSRFSLPWRLTHGYADDGHLIS